jgi:hypothetical protein
VSWVAKEINFPANVAYDNVFATDLHERWIYNKGIEHGIFHYLARVKIEPID